MEQDAKCALGEMNTSPNKSTAKVRHYTELQSGSLFLDDYLVYGQILAYRDLILFVTKRYALRFATIYNPLRYFIYYFRKSQLHRLHSGCQHLPVHGICASRLSSAAHCLENQRALLCTDSVAVFKQDTIFRLKHIARVLFDAAKP